MTIITLQSGLKPQGSGVATDLKKLDRPVEFGGRYSGPYGTARVPYLTPACYHLAPRRLPSYPLPYHRSPSLLCNKRQAKAPSQQKTVPGLHFHYTYPILALGPGEGQTSILKSSHFLTTTNSIRPPNRPANTRRLLSVSSIVLPSVKMTKEDLDSDRVNYIIWRYVPRDPHDLQVPECLALY